jgi:putative inorganic carbon (HCO3(-)) transporter
MQQAAAIILLGVLVARAFIAEMPFRTPLPNLQNAQATEGREILTRIDRGELARASFACLLLADGALWLVGAAVAGRLAVRRGTLSALIVLFAAIGLASVHIASDKRSAMDAWLEQVAMMAGGFLAVQCLADRRNLRAAAVALAAVGGVLAAKSVLQVLVEIPQTVAYWRVYGNPALALGSAAQRAFESRLLATTPTGYVGLSNSLASFLIVCLLAAAGLVADKCRRAVADWRTWRQGRAKGEIHTPALAATLTVLLAVAIAADLILTRSRGGILAAAAAIVVWAILMRWGGALAAHWRKAVAVAVALLLLGGLAVVAYGLKHDRLPSKTMTFRWHYWTGAADMIQDHPWLGVGPGNFGEAYMQYRRPAAEETVKLPHNSIVEVVSQYGLPGGLVYLAVVAVVLVGMCRPATTDAPLAGAPAARQWRTWPLAIVLAAAAAITRWLFSDIGADPLLWLLDGLLPAALLGVLTLVAGWFGGKLIEAQILSPGGLRVALACGVAGIFLHSMVEMSLSMPAVATAFWVAGGACLGAGGGGKVRNLSALRWPLAGLAAVGLIAAVAIFWWPVCRRVVLTEGAVAAISRQDVAGAAKLAADAAVADPLDGFSAADAARAYVILAATKNVPDAVADLTAARHWAQEAMSRDTGYYGHAALTADLDWLLADRSDYAYDRQWPATFVGLAAGGAKPSPSGGAADLLGSARTAMEANDYAKATGLLKEAVGKDSRSAALYGSLGDAAWQAGQADEATAAWRRAAELAPRGPEAADALACISRAVALNPMDLRLRLQAAVLYLRSNRPAEGFRQIQAAEWIDASLDRQSLMRFDADELRQLRMLRARAAALSPASRPAENREKL